MTHITVHGFTDVVTGIVAGASIVFRWLLPPPEKFADWPRFQGWYKLAYTFMSYAAMNK